MNILGVLLLCVPMCVAAQDAPHGRVQRLHLEGGLDAKFPVTLQSSHPLTVSFDLASDDEENLRVRVWHCDRNWKRTESVFVNNEMRNSSYGQLPAELAPQGVAGYRYTYSFPLPGVPGLERFAYSGNYTLELWDAQGNELLATARFFVAETLLTNAVRVDNRFLPSTSAPDDLVLRVGFRYVVPPPAPEDDAPIAPSQVRTGIVYRNREIFRPFRIDVDDQDHNTFVEGYGTRALKFICDNIPAGNEYRVLDVRNVAEYPAGQVLRRREGADIGRSFAKGLRDHNGGYEYVTEGRDADTVSVRFELLRPEEAGDEDIRLVGAFNDWNPSEEWRLSPAGDGNRYVLETVVRRGVYDYQYVLNGTDWVTLEGNDWRTVSVFTVLVYYPDPRLGGYDRILAVGQGRSPGGTEETAR